MPVIYLRSALLQSLSCLPLGFWSEPLLFRRNGNPIYLTLHRKEFTWFHYKLIYILSVALVLISRPTAVSRFAALWCPDFPTSAGAEINRPFFLWTTKVILLMFFHTAPKLCYVFLNNSLTYKECHTPIFSIGIWREFCSMQNKLNLKYGLLRNSTVGS